jgi:RNA recognition motif-containing protein
MLHFRANPKSSGLSRKIYVSGLPPNLTEKPLFQYFSNFGPIHTVNVVRDKQTGISRGFGFVRFFPEDQTDGRCFYEIRFDLFIHSINIFVQLLC